MKFIVFIASAFVLFSCNAEADKDSKSDDTSENVVASAEFMKPQKIGMQDLPSEVTVFGTFNDAWKWTDSLGDNIFVLYHDVKPDTQKNEFGEVAKTGSIYTGHYLKNGDRYRSIRTSSDEETACSFDLVCDFIPGSTTITDLDNDGFAEIKYQHTKACRSDVSPAAMTLVLRENGKNHILMGTRWVAFADGMTFNITEENANLDGTRKLADEMEELERSMGKYNSEYQFSDAPSQFLKYAKSEWLKYAKEEMGK